MIKIENLSKHYHNHLVIDHLSSEIERGKITAVIGPNGSGKSTLLSLISRLTDSSGGTIFIDSKNISDFSSFDFAKKLAILKQSNTLKLKISTEDLVSFGRFPYSKGRLTLQDKEAVKRILDFMELYDLKDAYIDQLSGGQVQKVFIAMTMVQDTDYLLLDEPLNNLDMRHAVQIMQLLRRYTEEYKKTIVIVIHDINFASCYADNIIGLKHGKILAQGSVEKVFNEEVLSALYDMPIPIQQYQGDRISLYYKASL
ncbi:ATP-binding cassette domain-containing protein [Streptococcus chenjunshii]|uniref:ATP-binding cassette domain-containing protein n=1 Tax=Streptococcus chenjunshii TaxID=2173853 RepID=A0A372KP27_9STRE|nr:ATP-binding cassette domain-containing protein [Streptococcus chenjunshii]AXQ78687.1 ATP-binding cassette domain-containing protein [Streptococcus chenjunshii]RFU51720.1 ATP-binding cassette domain-containing protein [Streptococcus chenjunshii]RFU54041.1 ATP-binding cassette domain-containing protein [Streptococcus chenjunshii]